MPGPQIFERIVQLCGLSEVLGPGIVRRSLADVGIDPERAEPADWRRVVPQLHKRLRAYLPEDDSTRRLQRIQALIGRAEAGTLTPNPDAPAHRGSGSPTVGPRTPTPDR